MATHLKNNNDGSISFVSGVTGLEHGRFGGDAVATQSVPSFGSIQVLRIALAATADTAGALAAVANPYGKTVYILGSSQLVVTTISAGACTVSIGPAANATTLSATLFSGISVAALGQTNSVLVPSWSSSQFLTASTASGASSGLVGFVLVTVFVP